MTHRAYRVARPFRAVIGAAIGVLVGPLAAAFVAVPAAMALEEGKGEEAAIHDCDRRLCTILLKKSIDGPDLQCALTKTWGRSTIKKADSQQVAWGFGDARCSVEIKLSREQLIAAMTRDRATFRVPRHTAHCVVEQNGRLEKVTIILAPKIKFRNGRARAVWIRLKRIDGPVAITLTVETAAQLADTFGLFHRQMVKAINRYIERQCPKTLAVAAKPSKAKAKTKAGK